MPIGFAQDRTAASSQHYPVQRGQLFERRRLARAKPALPCHLEDHRDFHAGARLDGVVRVVERLAQVACQHAAHRAFPRTHHADQKNVLRGDLMLNFTHAPILARIAEDGMTGSGRTLPGADIMGVGRSAPRADVPALGGAQIKSAPEGALASEGGASGIAQRTVRLSRRILGVTKINSSRRSLRFTSFLNKAPNTGTSPSSGTLVTSRCSS